MAWMLFEELIKASVVFLAGYLISGIRRVVMTENCLIKGCSRTAAPKLRGLCMLCYSAAKKKVETGQTTWQKLVELGLCKSEDSPFDDAYSKAMRDN